MRASGRRDAVLLASVLGVTLILGMILSVVAPGPRGKSSTSLSASSYSRGRNGMKALHDGLLRAGYPAKRFRAPLTRLETSGVLILVAPEMPLLQSEIAALQAWVARGNDLVLALSFDDAERASGPLIISTRRTGAAVPFPETPESFRPAFPSPFFRGVQRIATRWGCRIVLRQWDPLGRHRDPSDQESRRKDVPPLLPLAGDAEGAVLAESRLGRGRVITLADPWTPSNDGLKHADNARMMLNIIGPPEQGRAVMFDEYHHGYRDVAIEPLFSLLTWAGFAQALAALAIWAGYRAVRFGEPIPYRQDPRQRREYLDAMAHLLRRAGAQEAARRTMGEVFVRSLTRSLGLPPTADERQIGERAGRRGLDAATIRRLVTLARDPATGRPEELVKIAGDWRRALDQVERGKTTG